MSCEGEAGGFGEQLRGPQPVPLPCLGAAGAGPACSWLCWLLRAISLQAAKTLWGKCSCLSEQPGVGSSPGALLSPPAHGELPACPGLAVLAAQAPCSPQATVNARPQRILDTSSLTQSAPASPTNKGMHIHQVG